MNPAQLRVHIEAYLNLRSSLGFQTEYESYNLRELSDYIEAKGFSWPIHTQTILDWIDAASLHCGLPGQRMRLTQARCFLRHLKASVPETEVPGPGLLPHQPRPKPRQYSNEEIAKLQQATSQLWKPGSLSQLTPYFIIGLLASTGLRAGEVIALTVDDVRLDSHPPQLHIRKAKFYKSRIVPIHSSTADQLRAYLQERNRVKLRRPSKAFFITGRRLPLSYSALRRMFRQLLQSVGIKNAGGKRGPLLHSFRHYAASRTMPRGRTSDAIHGHSNAATRHSLARRVWHSERVINQLFTFSSTIERLRQGPLSEHLDAYAVAVAEQGYTHHSIRQQVVVIADLSRWLNQKPIALQDLDSKAVDRFLRLRRRQQRLRRGDLKALERLLAMLRQIGVVKPDQPPVADTAQSRIVAEFRRYLLQERGLSPLTLLNYVPVIEQFLSERFHNKALNFAMLRAPHVTGFVMLHAHQLSPVRAGLMVTALRSFFRYLRHRGAITTDLAGCVPAVPNRSLSTLPRFLPTDDVERILECCDRTTSVGRRNHAILLLLARLGVRAGEVVGLSLDDIDWSTGQITIRGKGGKSAQLPLAADVGAALAAYLRHDRPRSATRRVFLRHRAPLVGFGNSSTISSLVRRALKHAGVESAHTGAHVLRHSLATSLLRQGGSLDEIGELLRHQSPNTTAIYAKVDVTALHTLALPWPGGGR